MNHKFNFFLLLLLIIPAFNFVHAQNEPGEKIVYYQMEPLDDSLFIKMQQELFIDPPDPKAEIIADLRDPNNQTVSIKGVLYPFLALKPETRAKVITYPFKINLEEQINFGSVFSRVIEKLRIQKVFSPPTLYQISSTLGYINPFLQLFGGEQFGIPIKQDLGFSVGMGTPYSGPMETNIVEANFHILGFYGGVLGPVDAFSETLISKNFNDIYVTSGYQIGYVLPFGNFFEFSYQHITTPPTHSDSVYFTRNDIDALGLKAKVLAGSYYSWELRYPISILGSTRAKFYVAKNLGELHLGFTGRELSLGGSTFDFGFDAMPVSDVRQPEYIFNLLVQKIAETWASSAFSIGPSMILSKNDKGNFGAVSVLFNIRLKVGSSL
jgi:hypothetical protein